MLSFRLFKAKIIFGNSNYATLLGSYKTQLPCIRCCSMIGNQTLSKKQQPIFSWRHGIFQGVPVISRNILGQRKFALIAHKLSSTLLFDDMRGGESRS